METESLNKNGKYRKQVITDYENNIFIGLDDNDDIIKIDLENEREATVIPVQVV